MNGTLSFSSQFRTETNTTTPEDKKRLRISRACDFCRRKKVKCEFTEGKPCENCISYGVTCEFTEGTKKRGPPKGYIDALEKRIRKIESVLSSNIETPSPRRTAPAPEVESTSEPNTFSKPPPTYVPTSSRSRKPPRGASSDGLHYLGELSALQFLQDRFPIEGKCSEPWIKGRRVRRFGRQILLMDADDESPEHSRSRTPSIPSVENMAHHTGVHHWIYTVTGVDRHTSDRLLKIYFANIHPLLPVVEKRHFLRQYRDQVDSYPSADLLNAMFGAAARFVECEAIRRRQQRGFMPPDLFWDVPKGWSDQFFDQAESILCKMTSVSSISKVQSIILIHNNSGNIDSKSSACWLLGGLAIRYAQAFGLNRSCEEWDISEDEKQTRKRIWWLLYAVDRFQSASMGRPISIHDEDNDIEYPDVSASWREVLDEPESPDDDAQPRFPSATYRPANIDGRVEIYQLCIQLVKLSQILGRILQGLYTPIARKHSSQHGSDVIVTRLDHELTEWRFDFSKKLQAANFADFDEDKGYLAPAIACVLLCYFAALILLHRPFIDQNGADGKATGASYSSFRISTSAATRIVRIAENMSTRDFQMFPYLFSQYPMLQSCLIHMYNAKNPDARISAPGKAELTKAMVIVERLRHTSNSGQHLYNLLQLVMTKLNIDYGRISTEDSKPSSTNDSDGTSSFVRPTIPRKTSDVGRGTTGPRRRSGNSSPVSSRSPSQTPDMARNASSERCNAAVRQIFQTTTRSPDQINADMQGAEHIAKAMLSATSPSSIKEAYTLKQFGFDTSQIQMDQAMSFFAELQTLHQMAPTLPSQISMPPNIIASSESQGQASSSSNINSFIAVPSASTSTQLSYSTSLPNDQLQNVFRNNPNNPFWNIPSSMDWTEWSDWNQKTQDSNTWYPLQ